jgi:CRISPR-associated protein Csd1
MSWLQKLHLTYDAAMASSISAAERPWPTSHISKKAHVEVVLDQAGTFRRARKLERSEAFTLIPTTEKSAGRTAGDAPHPLCEELGYCAADLPEADPDRFSQYVAQLDDWCR